MKFILLITIFISVFAGDINSFFKDMRKKQEFYQDTNNSKQHAEILNKELKIPTANKVIKENKEILNTLSHNQKIVETKIPWITKNMIKGISKEQLKIITQQISNNAKNTKVDTIFYLFSTSQSEYVLYNFIKEANQLESVNKDIKYYGVVQGILTKKQLQKLYTPFKFDKNLEGKATIKMQPFIYRDLELKRVPAFLFSKCSARNFKYEECENKYLIRGEISLQEALEIVSKEDNSYTKYLRKLEKRGSE